MLYEEEIEMALENLRLLEQKDNLEKYGNQEEPQINCDVMEQLVKEYLKLAEENQLNSEFLSEQHRVITKAFSYIEKYTNPQPFKFEDFKIGLWVYDSQPEYEEFTFFKITKILSESDCDYLYHDKNKKVFIDNMTGHAREFKEGRFFPVTKAIEIDNIY